MNESENIKRFEDGYDQPIDGHFGVHGGMFVAETLMHALDQLESLYLELSVEKR